MTIQYLLTNAIDFLILRYYFKHISKSLRFRPHMNLLCLLCNTIILTLVNLQGIPLVNLFTCSLLTFGYSFLYQLAPPSRLLYVILYVGLGFLVEPLCFMLFECFLPEGAVYNSFILIIFTCEIFRIVIVQWIIVCKKSQTNYTPLKVYLPLILVPVLTVVCSCVIISVMQIKPGFKTGLLCLVIIMLLFINNVIILYVFEHLNQSLEEQKRADELLYEITLKDEYYREISENNRSIAKVKHNMQNQLTSLYAIVLSEDNAAAKTMLEGIIQELKSADRAIYTKNIIINTTLAAKYSVAVKNHISINFDIIVPETLSISHGECGILFGNLLDNAIESCCSVSVNGRYIEMKAKYINNALIIRCQNTIPEGFVPDLTSSLKKPSYLHNHGLSSVKEIVKKYHGTIFHETKPNTFIIEVLIYL